MITQYYNQVIYTNLVVSKVPTVPYSYQDFALTASVSGFESGTLMLKYFKGSCQDFQKNYREFLKQECSRSRLKFAF